MKIINLVSWRNTYKHLFLLASIIGSLISAEIAFASPEKVTQELFSFLVSEKHGTRLGTQQAIMAKLLSSELLTYSKIIECDAARAWKEEKRPLSYVEAEIFFDRWDTPMQCKASKSKANRDKQIVSVECQWGKEQDHSEGEIIQMFVYLVSEDGTWKVANIKHGRQEEAGNTKTDLISRMRTALKQSSHPEYCANKFGGLDF